MPESSNKHEKKMDAPQRASGALAPAREYTPPTTADLPTRALTEEILPEVQAYLKDLKIDDPRMEGGSTEKLFECYSEWLKERGQDTQLSLSQQINQMLEGAKAKCKDPAAIARLQVSIDSLRAPDTRRPAGRMDGPMRAGENAPATPATPATPAETREAAPTDLYGSVLNKLKNEAKLSVEPALKTVAEMEAIVDKLQLPREQLSKEERMSLLAQAGTFVRNNAGSIDAAYRVLPSEAENDGKGGHKFIVENGMVVGFHVNDMGTKFQTHRLLAPGTETFTIQLANNQEAWDIANNQADYLAKLRKDFAAPGKVVGIAVNRGTNQLVVRRMPEKVAPVAATPATAPRRAPYVAPARRPRRNVPRQNPGAVQRAPARTSVRSAPAPTPGLSARDKSDAQSMATWSNMAYKNRQAAQAIRNNPALDPRARDINNQKAAQLERDAASLDRASIAVARANSKRREQGQ